MSTRNVLLLFAGLVPILVLVTITVWAVINHHKNQVSILTRELFEMDRVHLLKHEEVVAEKDRQLQQVIAERNDAHRMLEMVVEKLPPSNLRHVETHMLGEGRISFVYDKIQPTKEASCSKAPSSSLSVQAAASPSVSSPGPSSSPAS